MSAPPPNVTQTGPAVRPVVEECVGEEVLQMPETDHLEIIECDDLPGGVPFIAIPSTRVVYVRAAQVASAVTMAALVIPRPR